MVSPIKRRYIIQPTDEIVLHETEAQKIAIPPNSITIFIYEKYDGFWYEKNSVSVTYKDESDLSTRKLIFAMSKIGPFASQESGTIFSSIDELYEQTGIRLTEDDMDAQSSRSLACKMIGSKFLYGGTLQW